MSKQTKVGSQVNNFVQGRFVLWLVIMTGFVQGRFVLNFCT